MFGILEAVSGPFDVIYPTYDGLIGELNKRMSNNGYKVVRARSHRSKIGGSDIPSNETVRVDLVCDRGGRPYQCHATKHKTTTKKTGCPWKAKAVNRKTKGGWVLTIVCDQHNHEPGTPEPPSGTDDEDADGEIEQDGEQIPGYIADCAEPEYPHPASPQADGENGLALTLAGVSREVLRLTGDTFHQFKQEFRKMSPRERHKTLSIFQLRIAAIYAVDHEDLQRQQRLETQEKRHKALEASKKRKFTGGSMSGQPTPPPQIPHSQKQVAQVAQVPPPTAQLASQSSRPRGNRPQAAAMSADIVALEGRMNVQLPSHHLPQHSSAQHNSHQAQGTMTAMLQQQQFPLSQTPIPIPQIPDFQQYQVPENQALHPAKRIRGHRPATKA